MSDKTTQDYQKIWSKNATKAMKNLVVKQVRRMSQKELDDYGWRRSAPVIEFTNGLKIIASMDDEGNDAGALMSNLRDLPVLPII